MFFTQFDNKWNEFEIQRFEVTRVVFWVNEYKIKLNLSKQNMRDLSYLETDSKFILTCDIMSVVSKDLQR